MLAVIIGLVTLTTLIGGLSADDPLGIDNIAEHIRRWRGDGVTPIHIHAVGTTVHQSVEGLRKNGYSHFTEAEVNGNPSTIEIYSPTPMDIHLYDIQSVKGKKGHHDTAYMIRIAQCDGANLCLVSVTGRARYRIIANDAAFIKTITPTASYHQTTITLAILLVCAAAILIPIISLGAISLVAVVFIKLIACKCRDDIEMQAELITEENAGVAKADSGKDILEMKIDANYSMLHGQWLGVQPASSIIQDGVSEPPPAPPLD